MSFEATSQMAKSVDSQKKEKPEKTQEELRQDLTLRMENFRLATLKQIEDYEDRLDKGEFDDRDGEPVGSGEKRKSQMQKELLRVDKQIDKIRETLASGQELPQESVSDIVSINTQNQAILESVFGKPPKEFSPVLIKPEDQDYVTLKADVDSTKFGEYILNPDTQNLDFENIPEAKIFIPDLSSFVGKPFPEVFKHLTDTYSATHHIPGLEHWKYLIENPNKTPPVLKDTNVWFYFPGSLVRFSDGRWSVPCADWAGSDWDRLALWLDGQWDSSYRVVLLEI